MHRINPWKSDEPARKYKPHFRKRVKSIITKPLPETREERQREIHEAVRNAGQRRPGIGKTSLDRGLTCDE